MLPVESTQLIRNINRDIFWFWKTWCASDIFNLVIQHYFDFRRDKIRKMSDMEIIEQRFSKLKNFEDDKDQFIQARQASLLVTKKKLSQPCLT